MTPAEAAPMTGVPEGFEFCDVRWDGPGRTDHICAEHKPGHEAHVCCCGAVRPEPRP